MIGNLTTTLTIWVAAAGLWVNLILHEIKDKEVVYFL